MLKYGSVLTFIASIPDDLVIRSVPKISSLEDLTSEETEGRASLSTPQLG